MKTGKFSPIRLLASLLLVTLLSGCSAFSGAGVQVAASKLARISNPQVPAEDQASLAAGNRAFALDLYHQLASGSQDNLVFSPYSLSTALAMTYAGAKGENADQMAQVLHFDLPQEKLHPAFNSLDQSLQALSQPEKGWLPFLPGSQKVELDTANSLWAQQGFDFLPQYLDTLGQNYGAGVRLVDYSSDKARQAINRWTSDQTKGKISELFKPDSLSRDTKLVLANAVYFKADWEKAFDPKKTHPGEFHLLDGNTVSVPMMESDDTAQASITGAGYQALTLPYANPEVELVILLPDDGQFTAFEAELDTQKLDEILGKLNASEGGRIGLELPKFTSQVGFDLTDTLAQMGMRHAFSGGDFSGMDGRGGLQINDIVHKAYLSVDEQGTIAAAATGIGMVTSIPTKLQVDRPFLYLIYDKSSGTILFLGRLLNPK